MTDRYLTIQDRQVKASDAVASLAEKRAKLAGLADPFARGITEKAIGALEIALREAGIAEDAEIVAAPVAARSATSRRSPYYGSVTATVEDAGDINNLLRRNGNAAAAE